MPPKITGKWIISKINHYKDEDFSCIKTIQLVEIWDIYFYISHNTWYPTNSPCRPVAKTEQVIYNTLTHANERELTFQANIPLTDNILLCCTRASNTQMSFSNAFTQVYTCHTWLHTKPILSIFTAWWPRSWSLLSCLAGPNICNTAEPVVPDWKPTHY